VVGISSGLCPVLGFGISSVEQPGSSSRELVVNGGMVIYVVNENLKSL
jgi:hypothetical protein